MPPPLLAILPRQFFYSRPYVGSGHLFLCLLTIPFLSFSLPNSTLVDKQYMMQVEILKNVGGVSFFPSAVHESLEGFNLRKYTAIHAPAKVQESDTAEE